MRTVEECYTYVIARRNEFAAQKRKRRAVMLKIIAPVCGIMVIAGIAAISKDKAARGDKYVYSSESGESVADSEYDDISSARDPIADSGIGAPEQHDPITDPVIGTPEQQDPNSEPAIDTPEYNNTLNIGEFEVAEEGVRYLWEMDPVFELSRDEVLEHFGLSVELELSGVVPELHEVPPKNGLLNIGGKHGFMRGCHYYENGDIVWEEISPYWENDQFDFESADGSQTATVFFQRKYSNFENEYDNVEGIPWLRSGMLTVMDDGVYSSLPFYELPPSIIAGVEMRIAKKSTGGYYAEFSTDDLCVGLDTMGISEEKTVAILEYLAEYVGAANLSENNDIHAEEYNVSFPEVLY